MQDMNEMYLQALTLVLAPMPWVLDQCNDRGVCVKDARGEVLFAEDFGGIPDEMSIGQREHIIERSKLFAQWLVAFSNDHVAHNLDLDTTLGA
jgi:hypothetical protein